MLPKEKKKERTEQVVHLGPPRLVLATHPKSSAGGHAHTSPRDFNNPKPSTTPSLPPNQPTTCWKKTMATPFCAAACRLPVAARPSAQAPRPRRGVVAVRAEAAGAGGGINPAIRKEEDKVVDTVLTGELAKPLTAYCRYG